jgi:competence protein ComEC
MLKLLVAAVLLLQLPPTVAVQVEAQPLAVHQQQSCVDINAAPADQLRRIIHVDTVRAAEIIRLRQQARFASVDQLRRVKGIGEARLRDIKQQGLACVPPVEKGLVGAW